jgi:DNA-binding transcriptional LysR family regulator
MGDPLDVLPRLVAGELDIALSHDAGGFDGVELIHLFDDPMYVALPGGHPLADADSLQLLDFAAEPWMLATSDSCPDSRLFLRACHAAGFEPQIAFQNDDYPAILGFVAAGVGVALVPDMVARGAREDVVIRPLDPAAPSRPIHAALPTGYRSPTAAAMVNVLREVGEEWVAGRLVFPRRALAA